MKNLLTYLLVLASFAFVTAQADSRIFIGKGFDGLGKDIGKCQIEFVGQKINGERNYLELLVTTALSDQALRLTVSNHPLGPFYKLDEYRSYWYEASGVLAVLETNSPGNKPWFDRILVAPNEYDNMYFMCSIREEL